MTSFRKSEFFKKSSEKKFNAIRKKITQIAPWAEMKLIGGTAIPGALTKGDVDLLVRLEKNQFSKTIRLFKKAFKENHRELWSDEFAIFKEDFSFGEKIDILVVIIHSKSDIRHNKATELLRNNKALLRKYNRMKSRFTDPESVEYKLGKRRFYDELERILSGCSKK